MMAYLKEEGKDILNSGVCSWCNVHNKAVKRTPHKV